MKIFIGTDVGGTFTDLWVADEEGNSQVIKSPTTGDILSGVINAVVLAAQAYGMSLRAFCASIEKFGHGTTVGLNALLTGQVAKTAVVTTAGFADTLEIGRIRRQTSGLSEADVTDFFKHNRFKPLVPRGLMVEVLERIDANGRVLIPLDEMDAREKLRQLKPKAVEAVAICTLWSTANPAHELRLRTLIEEELGDVFVSLSHVISPSVGEYGRMSTTAANAALGPIAGRYLAHLESALRIQGMRVPILMMTNAGGVLPTDVLNDRPAYSLFSGPAAGVMGSLALSEKLGMRNVLTTDVGGTSFDVGVIVTGRPRRRLEISLAGADIRVPSIDVASIGAGGGSIASVQFGDLTVGPQSAGANPGPACYGRGGDRPTATDADLVLGVLDSNYFIGGRMKLDMDAARQAIEAHVARPLGLSVEEAAWGIREILDNKMADLLRRVTIERGYDPAEFNLIANGGAGPSHAWVMARELGLKSFVVPAAATGLSAYGCANADLGLTDERPVYLRVAPNTQPNEVSLRPLDDAAQRGRKAIQAGLRAAGAADDIHVEQTAAVRYRGQTNSLDIEFESAVFSGTTYELTIKAFEKRYESLFGRGAGFSQAGFEILAIRTIGKGSLRPPRTSMKGNTLVASTTRKVVFDHPNCPADAAIYRIDFPAPGQQAAGPCIIEYPAHSVVVPPGSVARADLHGNMHVASAARP